MSPLTTRRKLSRHTSHRLGILRNLSCSLFKHGKILTTTARAKELRSFAERIITIAKRGGVPNIRRVNAILRDKEVAKKLFEDVVPRYNDRQGGYTRIIKFGRRWGDNAETSLLKLIEATTPAPEKTRRREKKGK